jgi:hypothetical protein
MKVLDRIGRGERLIVFRYKTPVATLQPLDGVVVQVGSAHDIYGWPIGGADEEVAKLNDEQRELLSRGVVRGLYIRAVRVSERFDWSQVIRSLEDLGLRGLATKTERGWELTGRGMVLRETLLKSER